MSFLSQATFFIEFLSPLFGRDYDQEQIDLDDLICQSILHAVFNLPYSEGYGADVNSVELYETDVDVSTPDRTTTNSDPEAIVSHLAEQESAFSEDTHPEIMTPTESLPPEEMVPEEEEPSTSHAHLERLWWDLFVILLQNI